ncbi:RtcB family protein [Actinomadura harenae]|nr:RtcB family protein [Actinomadura harenae]
MHCDPYLTGRFTRSPLAPLLAAVAELPTVSAVEVFPDVTAKSYGLPSGVVIETRGSNPLVLPAAVPDIACGFLVIATGILPNRWPRQKARQAWARVVSAIGVTSPTRRVPAVDIDHILTEGETALAAPRHYLDPNPSEQPRAAGDPSLLPREVRRALNDHIGSVTGHFVSAYTAHPSTAEETGLHDGELVLVVHTGAPVLQAWAYEALHAPMAERCMDTGLVPPDLVAQHAFGLSLDDPLAQDWLNAATSAVLYGHANRRLVADTILDILNAHDPLRAGTARLLRHTGHGWHHQTLRADLGPTAGDGETVVRSGRGIQHLPPARTGEQPRLTFVTGGAATHAYLFQPGPHADRTCHRIGHGTPMWTHHPPLAHLRDQPETQTISEVARTVQPAAEQAITNTTHNPDAWLRDLANLELVAVSLETTGLARRAALLQPWANYLEPKPHARTPR